MKSGFLHTSLCFKNRISKRNSKKVQIIEKSIWRDVRAVEGSGLENQRTRKCSVGSNPTLSATKKRDLSTKANRVSCPFLRFSSFFHFQGKKPVCTLAFITETKSIERERFEPQKSSHLRKNERVFSKIDDFMKIRQK